MLWLWLSPIPCVSFMAFFSTSFSTRPANDELRRVISLCSSPLRPDQQVYQVTVPDDRCDSLPDKRSLVTGHGCSLLCLALITRNLISLLVDI